MHDRYYLFTLGPSVSLVETSVEVTEGNSGTTSVEFCVELESDLVLARAINIILNTESSSSASKCQLGIHTTYVWIQN